MIAPEQKIAELQADVAFLLARCAEAGRAGFSSDRWTGMSSNALVSVAYGGEQAAMPYDRFDYAACVRTYARLPRHRRTPEVRAALRLAKAVLITRHPECATAPSRNDARREAERQERERKARVRRTRRHLAAN
ncbi:MAG: hypothetical protein ACAH20_02045 [Methylobacteriaceae bacterium]